MTIEVFIERTSHGFLTACVVQRSEDANGNEMVYRGDNLVAQWHIKDVDKVVQRCDAILMKTFKLLDPAEIRYIGPEVRKEGAEEKEPEQSSRGVERTELCQAGIKLNALDGPSGGAAC